MLLGLCHRSAILCVQKLISWILILKWILDIYKEEKYMNNSTQYTVNMYRARFNATFDPFYIYKLYM